LHHRVYFISNFDNPIYFNSLIDYEHSKTNFKTLKNKILKNLKIKFKYEIIFLIYLHFIFMQWFNLLFENGRFLQKREHCPKMQSL
jgi:hypothetical protein